MTEDIKEKIKSLELKIEELCEDQKSLLDVNRLLLECVSRIASGKSKDARLDACNTMRGCAIISIEAMK